MVTSFDVTRRALSFGAQDLITGWYGIVRSDSTIKASVQPKGVAGIGGYSNKYANTCYTDYVVHEGDQIKDQFLDVYELATVTPMVIGNKFDRYECEAILKEEADLDATSGTWHKDTSSGTITTDPRSRTKTFLETYPLSGDYILQFDGQPYLMKYLFNNKLGVDADLVVSCGQESSVALSDYKLDVPGIYAFVELPTITLWAINKSGITPPRVLEQAEQEIKHTITDHSAVSGLSIRKLQSIRYNREDLRNGGYLWSVVIGLKYKRVNDDYTPTETLTFGSGGGAGTFTYPNIIHYRNPFGNRDNFTDMPGRQGDYPFLLGAKSDTIDITCDLDIGDWKRPQGNPVKTDSVAWQVFKDIVGNGGVNEASQVLTVAGESHAVRLSGNLELSPDNHTITLHFTEYNASPASSNYKTRHGYS